MLTIRLLLFLCAALQIVWCQTVDPSASRSAPAAAAAQPDWRDQFIKLVGPAPPGNLTEKQRFHEYLKGVVGPVPLVGEAVGAAFGQAINSPEEWGQGWDAFGKRYLSNLGYNAVRQTITYGGSVALKEDPRYFGSRSNGFWKRAGHAAASTFIARRPDGTERFAVSATAGVVGAAAISSLWGPPSWRTADSIAFNAGMSFASTAALNVVREFLPDLLRKPRK